MSDTYAPSYTASTFRPQRLDAIDCALVILFLLGLYLGLALQVTEKVPLTCAPSGFAGLWMLWRRRDDIRQSHLAGLMLVLLVYIGSIMSAQAINYLGKRTTGLLQLTYSLMIAYGMFLTLVRADRRQVAAILLSFCLAIITGCMLETWAGLRPVSDFVRAKLYNTDYVYDADIRDEILYGKVRPKLFTSEPSAVTFAYTHYCAVWLAVSPWRYKYLVYAGLLGLAIIVLPGPTLMLMLLLAVPYCLFLAGGARRTSPSRMVGALVISAVIVIVAYAGGKMLFAERLNELQAGKDASFFYRFTGPMLVAFDMFRHHPWAGSGLTGEPFIADRVLEVFMNSASFSSAWRIPKVADVLTNFFWLHWIYLGAVWGVIVIVTLSLWLRMLGAASILYCWAIWSVLGQASGSYVGPKTWAVLLIGAATGILVIRPSERAAPVETAPAGPLLRPMRPRLRLVEGRS
ncbi:MAG: hypothetical protein J0J01_15890 [Reyranella sp.]|uniref:O-antigen ligase family protein n=1 Tax=Reyranella sp. TaxID=1929291 RepID=UPI001ACE3F17|nr:O-antigen ligase family protein [Reyranella sp.]MBN9088387.1 hypothetical protein [Reyranella sp.]